jgi:hypothetical protein
MIDTKWCCENINSGHFKFESVLGEVKEVFEARSIDNLKEELQDVLYFWNCWLYSNFRINLPMFGAMGSVRKFMARLEVWNWIFYDNKLLFDPKYLVNGSNYNKPEKIEKALELARREQK